MPLPGGSGISIERRIKLAPLVNPRQMAIYAMGCLKMPVVDAAGHSVRLPGGVSNKFGYGIDFDAKAKYEGYTIDFEAIGEHLYQLDAVAKAKGFGIALVIFDPALMPSLFATKRGDYLKAKINFMKGKAWVRHDDHYHVDFAIPCKPNEPVNLIRLIDRD